MAYRTDLQLDRADDGGGFDDPVEVTTDEVAFALAGPDADERGCAVMDTEMETPRASLPHEAVPGGR